MQVQLCSGLVAALSQHSCYVCLQTSHSHQKLNLFCSLTTMITAYVRGKGRAHDGVAADISWKAWAPDQQGVSSLKWDMVRVALSLQVGGPGRLPFYKWWQQKRPSVSAMWEEMGVAQSEFVPSSRTSAEEDAKDVPTLSSKALVYFLLHCMTTSRRTEDRSLAFATCFGWVGQCIPAEELQIQTWIEEVFSKPGKWRACAVGQPSKGLCPHMLSVREDGFQEPDRHLALVRLLRYLCGERRTCPILKECLQNVSRQFVAVLDVHVEAAAYTHDPTKADGYEEAGKKRRRIDGDYKRAVTSTVIETGRASSSSTFLRADGVVAGKRAAEWEEKELLKKQAALWFATSSATVDVVVVSSDAGRFGEPAEETLVSACEVWTSEGRHFAAWLPPQVRNNPGKPKGVPLYGSVSLSLSHRLSLAHLQSVSLQPPVCIGV